MTHTHIPAEATTPAAFLPEQDNQRAVDLIENAERSAPYCPCGQHMIAVAKDDAIWLQCSSRSRPQDGLAGLIGRLTAFGHARRMIMELPSAN